MLININSLISVGVNIVQKNYVLPFKSNFRMMQVATAHNSRTSLIYSVCAPLSLS